MATTATPGVGARAAAGRVARQAVPRRTHAAFAPAAHRPDPIDLLEGQAADRIPELAAVRHGRMAASPYAFSRGAALVMASDLATVPDTGLRVQLCGDAHMANFGTVTAPGRRPACDIVDFDETLPGPFEWDVKRLVASLAIAGRAGGAPGPVRADIVLAAAARYRTAMARFAAMGNLAVFSAPPEAAPARAPRRPAGPGADGAWTIPSDGDPARALDWARGLLRDHRRSLLPDRRRLAASYRPVAAARRVAGVGGVGRDVWSVRIVGRDDVDALVLQIAEAPRSVLERYLGRSEYRNGGHRVVAGQRLMQAAPDPFLGYVSAKGLDARRRDYHVRRLPERAGPEAPEGMSRAALRAHGEMCGATLARAHARSGDRIAIASYLGRGTAFDEAMAAFAEAYADQNDRDHAALVAAVAAGRIAAAGRA